MKYITLLIACMFALGAVKAQDTDRIETDRPNETEIPAVVPRKFFQIEAGIYSERTTSTIDMVSHPTALFRYGLSNHLELRLYTKLTTVIENRPLKDISTTGLEPVELGFKVSITEGRKWIPQTSINFQTGLAAIASKSFQAPHLGPELRLLMENEITKSLSITYNIGAEWDGSDTEPEWVYTFTPGLDIGKKLHAFVEAFSFFKRNESPEHTIDGGIEYFIRKNFTLDICSGLGLNKAAPGYFVTVGGSVRFR